MAIVRMSGDSDNSKDRPVEEGGQSFRGPRESAGESIDGRWLAFSAASVSSELNYSG